jgi:hypothetical protein
LSLAISMLHYCWSDNGAKPAMFPAKVVTGHHPDM